MRHSRFATRTCNSSSRLRGPGGVHPVGFGGWRNLVYPLSVAFAVGAAPIIGGCGAARTAKCGIFTHTSDARCPEGFRYSSVVRIESGRKKGGVYRCYNSGTGVIVDRSGIVLTASHVVNGRDLLAVFLEEEGSVYAAEPVPGGDFEELDLAFLRIVGAGEKVRGGSVLSRSLQNASFPCSKLAGYRDDEHAEGQSVHVVGYPYDKPMALAGKLIDPREKLAHYIKQNRLNSHFLYGNTAAPKSIGLDRSAPNHVGQTIAGYRIVRQRMEQGCLFVEIDASHRFPGVSGGAILRDGKLVGIAIESWNSFEKTVLIGVPISEEWIRRNVHEGVRLPPVAALR